MISGWTKKSASVMPCIIFLTTALMASMISGCKKDGGDITTETSKTTVSSTAKLTVGKSGDGGSKTGTTSKTTSQNTQGSETSQGTEAQVTQKYEAGSDSEGETGQAEDGQPLEKASFDLGGATIVWNAENEEYLPGPGKTGYFYYYWLKTQELQEKYNFKMNFISNYKKGFNFLYQTDLVNNLMAGINPGDILTFSSNANGAIKTFISSGLLMPLNDHLNNEQYPSVWNNKTNGLFEWYNKLYGISHVINVSYGGIIWNKDIFDRESIENPLDLYEQGRWKWDAFLDACIQATKDTNGDGITDQWGLTVYNNSEFLTKMLNSNGVAAIQLDNDGRIENGYGTIAGLRALQFISELGFVHKVYTGTGSAGYKTGKIAMIVIDTWANSVYMGLGMNSWCAPPPKGPDAPEFDFRITQGSQSNAVCSLTKYPDEVAVILAEASVYWNEDANDINDTMKSLLLNTLNPWDPGRPNRGYNTEREYKITSDRSIQSIWDLTSCLGLSTITGNIAGSIIKGENAVTTVEMYRDQVNAVLDEYK